MRRLSGIVLMVMAPFGALAGPHSEAGENGSGETSADGGVLVAEVDPGSPAEKAGIRRGAIILKADKIELDHAGDLAYYLGKRKPGDSITLKLLFGEDESSVAVTLGERDGGAYLGVVPARRSIVPGVIPRVMHRFPEFSERFGPFRFGFEVGGEVALLVVDVSEGSPAAGAGIQSGDLVVGVNGEEITAPDFLVDKIRGSSAGDTVALRIVRDGGEPRDVEVVLAESDDDGVAYLGIRYTAVPRIARDWVLNPPQPHPGVMVLEVEDDGPADLAGIAAGELMLSVDGERVTVMSSLSELIGKHSPGDQIGITVSSPDGDEREVSVTLGSHPDDAERAYLGIVPGGQGGWFIPRQMPRLRRESSGVDA